jgi:RimJ/RimL family protein N-acetyltransferase
MKLYLANMEDLNAIDRIFKNAIANMIKNNIYQWDEIYPNKGILEDDITKKQLYKTSIDGNNIISTFVLNQEYDKEYSNGKWKYNGNNFLILHRLCVNTEYQNRGFGAKTMSFVESYLKNSGIESIRLDAFSNNPIALKMYDKLGYKKTGEAIWRKGLFYLFEKIL